MTTQKTYTHKGWVGLCPVYIADIDTEMPDLTSRIPFTDWFLELNLSAFDLIADAMEFFGAEPQGYPIQITGVLSTPKVIAIETETIHEQP